MARDSQKIIQLLRSTRIYQPSTEYVNKNDATDVKTPAEYAQLDETAQANYDEVNKTALENAMASFDAAFIQAAQPQDGEIMLARYQEANEPVKAVLAAYTNKNGVSGFTFYIDSVAINTLLQEVSEKIDVIEVKNALRSSDSSINITDGNANTRTDVTVNVDNATIGKTNAGALKSNLSIVKVSENLPTNVAEAYELHDANGTKIGSTIPVYKDSALKEAYLGTEIDTVDNNGNVTKYVWQLISNPTNKITNATYEGLQPQIQSLYERIDVQYLNFVYYLADGTYSLVNVDVNKFLTESEFGAGLKVQSGVVSLDVTGQVTVGQQVTYVAINSSDETDKLTAEEYAELTQVQQANYYTYVNSSDPTDMITDAEYAALSQAEQEGYNPISINDTIGVQTNVFNESNGVVDVNAIQDAIDYASLAAAEGVRVSGSDAIRVDNQNTVYLRLSGETDNVLGVETGANKGLYLSGTWDCGEY